MKIKLSENLCRPEDMKCLKETDETLYCIVAKTLDGKTKFYKDGAFIDDYKNCTTFNDLDEARAEWFDIDKSKYRRVFVPVYDPEAFKQHLTESKEASRDIILEIVQGEFETGHNIADSKEEFFKMMRDEGIRPSTRMWDFYNECHNLGPAGFYDEYKDVLDFDPMFVSEYGAEEIDDENTVESAQGFNLYDKVKVKRFNMIGTIIDLLDYDGRIIAVVKGDTNGDPTGWSEPRRFDLNELEHVISESAELKNHETPNGSLLKESRSVKVDEDTANEIALMAMRAMRLKEHEAQALEYDLIEGNADKWIKDFEALPDNSDVKKLFFTFAVKANEELTESAARSTDAVDTDTTVYVDKDGKEHTGIAAKIFRYLDSQEESTDVADEVDATAYVDKKGNEHTGIAAKLARYFDSLDESKESETCCICKQPIKGYGNNAEPVCSGRCCDKCNMDVVLPARVKAFRNRKNESLSHLPDSIYTMLTDMAQMCGEFDYTDIYKFTSELADEAALGKLKHMYRRWKRAAGMQDDAKMEILAKETADIIKKPLRESDYDDDIDDYYANF